ncbi:hypothetical protein LINPERPRIM_LOCUS15612 [Linum perenne]
MDIGHHGAGDVPVNTEEVNLQNLRSEIALETDRLEGDDNKDVGGVSEGIIGPSGPQPVVSKCLEDSTTSPCPEIKPSNLDVSNEDSQESALHALSLEQPLQHAQSVPIKSALKGSREKQGKEAKQLSVTWAPDVYDPVPNSLCHTVKSSSKKKSRKDKDRDKKSGKKGQKSNGSSSRGSSSKDKKQIRRKPAKSYKALDMDDDGYGDTSSSSSIGFDVTSPDYCGSSFLKQSVTEFHYSVAEAL